MAVVHFATMAYTAHKVQEKPYFSSICPRANARDDNLLANDFANASFEELFYTFFFSIVKVFLG